MFSFGLLRNFVEKIQVILINNRANGENALGLKYVILLLNSLFYMIIILYRV